VPTSRLDVDHHHTCLFQRGQVLGHTGIARADSGDDIPARRRPTGSEEPKDFVSRPVAECRDGSLDVRRPGGVVRLRNSRHKLILPEGATKSKNSTLDDTLIIFDNNSYSFC
jgi:hypothetical protein